MATGIVFKNLRPNIADAIKESCYKSDARLYNIANDVHQIVTFTTEPEVEMEGLSKIIDKTIEEAEAVGCDSSVVIKGILLGAFRSTTCSEGESRSAIRTIIKEILLFVFQYKVNIKQAVEGLLAGVVIIANEFKLNVQEALVAGREDIVSSSTELSPASVAAIKEALSSLNDFSA